MSNVAMQASDRLRVLGDGFAEYVSMSQRRGPGSKRAYMYASQRGRCLRRSVLEATEPDVFSNFDAEAKARMWRGSQRERDIVIDLKRAGQLARPRFDVVGEQEHVRIRDRQDRVVISGRTDGRIAWEDGESWPIEIKSWSPFLTERIESFSDLFENRWTWNGAHQLLAYLYSKPEPRGVLVLDRPGSPKFIEVVLEENLEQMEGFLRDAETCVDHIEAGTLPPFIDDAVECRRCPAYGAICNPPISAGDVRVFTDEHFLLDLERWHGLRDAGDEYNTIDARIRKRLRAAAIVKDKDGERREDLNGIAGEFAITGKWGTYSRLELPEDLKKKHTVKDPKGRFLLEIDRV